MGNKKKKNNVVLDLSLPAQIENTNEFEVGDYDYELRQGDRLSRFDEDLHFLLTQPSQAPEKTSGVKIDKERQKSTPKDAVQKISDKAVLNKDGLSAIKKIATLSPKELKEIEKYALALKSNPGKVSAKSTHVTVKDIKGDLDEIVFSSDDEGPVILKQGETFKFDFDMGKEKEKENAQSKKVRRRKLRRQKSDAPPMSESAQVSSVSSDDITSSGSVSKISLEVDPSKADTLLGKTSKATKTAKSYTSKPVNTISQRLESPSKDSIISESTPTPAATSNDKGQKNRKRTSPSPVSIVDSQTSIESEFSRVSVSKALKQLPVVQPVSTISGLTHEQIYKTKLSDVKVKLIANVPMSKMCKNALSFVMDENEGLFEDAKKRKQFVDLSIHVALCEAPGFNKVIKRTPEILDWVSTYRPLTLDHTRTNVTLSERNVHKNNLDYTVFSFFGHILLWANELQFSQKMPTIIEEYGLDLLRKNILDNLGGSHLWERLRQNKTINAKRWKHIQKYRRIFAFEEHQFVLILRCMNLGIPLA